MNQAMEGLPLNANEARVLGALVEKEVTTPEYYPLSLNALTAAANQINNRDPVMSLGENEVLRAVESLRDKRLAYVFSGAVSRVVKYGNKFAEALALNSAERAALCVLLLRGPQTLGEIRGRTGRMHEFADLPDVQATLNSLAGRAAPLVAVLPRQAGTKEARYAHLLCGEPKAAPVTASPVAEPAAQPDEIVALRSEVEQLRRELAELRQQFAGFRKQFE